MKLGKKTERRDSKETKNGVKDGLTDLTRSREREIESEKGERRELLFYFVFSFFFFARNQSAARNYDRLASIF